MVLSIPYCGAHVIAGSPSIREWLEGDRPDVEDDCQTGKQIVALVRKYWGESEGMPYADRLVMEQTEHEGGNNNGGNGNEQIVDWTVLEADAPHNVRVQQGRIEELKHRPARTGPRWCRRDQLRWKNRPKMMVMHGGVR